MRRIKLVIEYDGTPFDGFQRHTAAGAAWPEGLRPIRAHVYPTVQDELDAKLGRLLAHPVKTWCAGRTDAGVHATGQVIAFETPSQRPLPDLLRGANAVLCDHVRVLSVEEVGPDFHPRFSAKSRIYHYYIAIREEKDPFLATRLWSHPRPLDLERMQRAADRLVGSHDFSAYGRGVPEDEPRRRHLTRLAVHACPVALTGPFGQLASLLRVEVEANAFLRRMVRVLVGNLTAVGRGEWDVDEPFRVLQSLDPLCSCPSAPPHGLYLVQVLY